jgi:hypothetical protein
VNRIGNSIKEIEEQPHDNAYNEDASRLSKQAIDRRSSERVWLYSPVLVYGLTTENEPFHEGTEALHANARGGLITLTTPVRTGQRLLLINKANRLEQICRVISQPSQYLKRTAVIIEFRESIPSFWTKPSTEI